MSKVTKPRNSVILLLLAGICIFQNVTTAFARIVKPPISACD